ncbi:MAG: hypothetical protein ACTSVI_08660 [Promethearchaeota archaeon]
MAEAEELMKKFETIPFTAFFKVWYHIQKDIPEEKRKDVIMRIGRGLSKEINLKNVETIDDFFNAIKKFLVEDWAITDRFTIEKIEIDDKVAKVKCTMDSCKMCFPNSYYKKKDDGSPTCMFPQIMMGALSRVKNKFKFKNVAYDCVEKPGPVGYCIMTFNTA